MIVHHSGNTAMESYQYETLFKENYEIRVLRFVPDTNPAGLGEPAIQLALDHVSLDDNPKYLALSYTWGERKGLRDIIVNSRRLEVNENLFSALLVLQRICSTDQLWIDAICINQRNDDASKEEKSWQIGQMGRVFETAATVLVWLGSGTQDSDVAMQELENFGSDAIKAGISSIISDVAKLKSMQERIKESLRWPADRTADEGSPEALALQLYHSHRFQRNETQVAIANLLDRDIWHRAWVFQEIALAKDGYILCGNKQLPIPCFDAAVAMINQCKEASTSVRRSLEDCFPRLKFEMLNIRGLKVRRQRKLDLKPRLASLLFYQLNLNSRHFSIAARDPEDLIYSLLGIAGDTVPRKDENGNDIGPLVAIGVDKKKPPEEVFTESTNAFLKHCTWYKLEYCSFPKDMDTLPSWVPDYKRIAACGISVNPLSIWGLFRASANKGQPSFQDAANPEALLRGGCRVDVISLVMEPPDWIFSEAEQDYKAGARAQWLEAIQRFAEHTSEHAHDVWRAVTADMQHNRNTTQTFRVDEKWTKILEWMLSGAVELTSVEEPWWGIPAEKHDVETSTHIRQAYGLLSYAEWVGYGRTLLRTKGGRIGLGPTRTEIGDVVTIIFGTQVPIVLRPLAEERFEFVGEAYFHGLMDGEYMETNPQGETFEII